MKNKKSKKPFGAMKLGAALATLAVGLGAGGIRAQAAFDAPYYNININGGTFDGNQYVLDDGRVVTNSFFCDGTYTYFLQTDGTPMRDRLTYHPDGVKIIYFDSQGHECFDTFANVKKSIEGNPVDDLCYFGTYGDLYVNVITYNKEGTQLYYANPYGVMERNGVFELDTNAANYEILAQGCHYGYANSDGSIKSFYATYEDATTKTVYLLTQTVNVNTYEVYEGCYESHSEVYTYQYDDNGNLIKQMKSESYESESYGCKNYGMLIVDMQYDEQNRLVREICTDENGNIVDNIWMSDLDAWDVRRNTSYEYDENGLLSKKVEYREDGTIWQEETYSYDEYGNLVKVQYSDTSWDEYHYNSAHKLLWIREYYNGKSHMNVSYVYDQNGNLAERWGYVSMTGGFPIDYYGENGLLTRTAYRDRQGNILDDMYDEYDAYGNIVKSVNGSDVKTYQYTYDANGNMTSKVDPFNRSYVYTYDEHGNLVMEKYYCYGELTSQTVRTYTAMKVKNN